MTSLAKPVKKAAEARTKHLSEPGVTQVRAKGVGSKRPIRVVVADRGPQKPLAKRANSLQVVEMRNVRGITEIAEGFYVIEAMRTKGYANLPRVPDSRVRAVIENYRSAIRQDSEKNSENQQFIQNLKGQALLSRQKHIDDGSLIKASELWNRLGISRQAGSKAISEFRMFSLDGPGGVNLCPAFFADPEYDRTTLETVSKELGALPGPSKWQFFTTPKVSLKGKTPLEAIKRGQIDEVVSAAVGFRER